tara:strand:- start:347 stop:520 length:174 start_codon:yes stop_codon:yes gene_type:complete
MTIEKRKSDGAIIVSDIIDNQLITKTYIGYTERESKSLFKKEIDQEYYESFEWFWDK